MKNSHNKNNLPGNPEKEIGLKNENRVNLKSISLKTVKSKNIDLSVKKNPARDRDLILNTLFAHMSDQLVVVNKNIEIVYSNTSKSKLDHNYFQTFCSIANECTINICDLCNIENIFKTKQEIIVEKNLPLQNKYFEITAFPVIEEEQVKYVAVISRDVTTKKLNEIARQESEERFKSFFDNIQIGFYRANEAGKLLMANKSLLEMLGFDTENDIENINKSESGYLHSVYKQFFIDKINKTGEVKGFESVWKRKDGIIIYLRENAKLIKNDQGKILYYEGTVENITQQKKAEIKLLAERQKAEEKAIQKDKLFRKLSREIKEPLEQIISVSDLRSGTKLSSEKCEVLVEIVNKTGTTLLDLVENIQILPELHISEPLMVKKRFPVNRMMTEIYKNFFEFAGKSEDVLIIGKTNLSDDQAYLFTYRKILKKIFNNLISLCLRNIEKGVIEFGYNLKQEYFEFYVSDSSSDISKYFSTENNDSNEEVELIVAKGLTESIEGMFEIKKNETGGTVFSFNIPTYSANFI